MVLGGDSALPSGIPQVCVTLSSSNLTFPGGEIPYVVLLQHFSPVDARPTFPF